MTRVFPVQEISRVAEVRRAALTIAEEENLHFSLAGNVALIATEICTNLVKHAQSGEVIISSLSDRSEPGVEIVAVDRGPGIADVARCLSDGYSTTSTAGNGLGAIARISQEFDIYSEPGQGTALVARVHGNKKLRTPIGICLKPIAGEELSGDAWAIRRQNGFHALMVVDGLGHGALASRAASAAVECFTKSKESAPVLLLQKIHAGLRGTRGAAVAVAVIDRAASSLKYAGIGNIAGLIASQAKPAMMLSHNGTAGFHAPRFQEFSYAIPAQGVVIMHSDGLRSDWNLDRFPGLRQRDPSIIAAVLYREAARERDDLCIVVVRTEDLA